MVLQFGLLFGSIVDCYRLICSNEDVSLKIRLVDHFRLVKLLPSLLGNVVEHGAFEMALEQ